MSVVVRFAPSPTGLLHVGNVRTALFNWLFVRKMGGTFVLRMDDTDTERGREEYAVAIHDDLKWLGLDWDREEKQSARLERYREVVEELIKKGRIYPCYETAEEIEYKRKRLRSKGLPPIYDRAALKMTDADKAKYEAEGRKPHYRFLLNHEETSWEDLVRGHCHYNGAHQSDPVVIREDGSLLYMLPSVIDDADFGITHVIRGEDHVTNAAIQIQMFEAMGAKVPAFAHLPLITGMDGKLSKRMGSLSMQDLRKAGLEPMAVNILLAHLGAGDSFDTSAKLEDLLKNFELSSFGRSQPRFVEDELWHLNSRILHNYGFNEVKDRLAQMGINEVDEAFWETVKPNLSKFEEVKEWFTICNGKVSPVPEGLEFTKEAAKYLPEEPWHEGTWDIWVAAVKEATGKKGRDLFHPLRMALTGLENGPELKRLLPQIGRDKALRRLNGETA